MTYAQTIAGQLKEMAANNQHSEAVYMLCTAFETLKPQRMQAKLIWDTHKAAGHLSERLCGQRRDLMHAAFATLENDLTTRDYKAIRGAF